MKKFLSFLILIVCAFAIYSCGGGNKQSESLEVQKDFLGVSLGQSMASVCEELTAQGYTMEATDSKQKVRWTSADSIATVSFGGTEWSRFTTYFYNDKLGEIRFYIEYKGNKDDAKLKYEQLEKTLASKYGEFSKVSDTKDNIIYQKEIVCKDGKIILSLQDFDEGLFSKDTYLVGLTYLLQESVDENVSEF